MRAKNLNHSIKCVPDADQFAFALCVYIPFHSIKQVYACKITGKLIIINKRYF